MAFDGQRGRIDTARPPRPNARGFDTLVETAGGSPVAQNLELEEILSMVAAILGTPRDNLLADPAYGAFARVICEMHKNGPDPVEGRMDPVRSMLASIGDRWTALLIQLLAPAPLRFSMLQRIIQTILEDDISRQILSMKLHSLELDGFVLRVNLGGARPAVEYSLTPLGQDFATQIGAVVEWARSATPAVRTAREIYDGRDAS